MRVSCKSRFAYPEGFELCLKRQAEFLRKVFPQSGLGDDLDWLGWAVPSAEAMQRFEGDILLRPKDEVILRGISVPKSQTMEEAVARRFIAIAKEFSPSFEEYCDEEFGSESLLLRPRTRVAHARLAERCRGDVLIFPAEMGLRTAGQSPAETMRRFRPTDFGLDIVSIGLIALACEPVMSPFVALWLDAGGNAFAPGKNGEYADAPYWFWVNGVWTLDWNWDARARAYHAMPVGTCWAPNVSLPPAHLLAL